MVDTKSVINKKPKELLKNAIHNFSAWRSANKEKCEEKAGKLACCVHGKGI